MAENLTMKKTTKIKNKSKKLSAQDKIYSKLRKEFLELPENCGCRAVLPGCTLTKGLTVHHKKGRGIYYLDTSTWVTLCLPCHQYIETHPDLAKMLGFSESRLKS